MTDLLIHPRTAKALDNFVSRPAHALIIDGPMGSGKRTLATELAGRLLGITLTSLDNNAQVLNILPTGSTVSIDDIRALGYFVKLKMLGQANIKRVVVIEQAELMTKEAQNALLKLLEEPPADTVLLLTTANMTSLLPTIRSRAQKLVVHAPDKASLLDHFASLGNAREVERAYYMSQGRVGLMSSILSGELSELLEQIEVAKRLLAAPVFERLIEVDSLVKQKASFGQFLQALEIVCHAGLVQASEHDKSKQTKSWHASLKAVLSAQTAWRQQANLKLVGTSLLLNL